MIPAQPGTKVLWDAPLTNVHGDPVTWRRHADVVAWDEDGWPLITGDYGRLEGAPVNNTEIQYDPIVAVVPGAGWVVHWLQDDGVTWSDPVIAWTVTASGGQAIIQDDHGSYSLEAADPDSLLMSRTSKCEVLPPGELPSWDAAFKDVPK